MCAGVRTWNMLYGHLSHIGNTNIMDHKGIETPMNGWMTIPLYGKQTVFLTMAHVALSQFWWPLLHGKHWRKWWSATEKNLKYSMINIPHFQTNSYRFIQLWLNPVWCEQFLPKDSRQQQLLFQLGQEVTSKYPQQVVEDPNMHHISRVWDGTRVSGLLTQSQQERQHLQLLRVEAHRWLRPTVGVVPGLAPKDLLWQAIDYHRFLQPYSKSPRNRPRQGQEPGLPGQGQHGFGLLLFAFLLRPDLHTELRLGAGFFDQKWAP